MFDQQDQSSLHEAQAPREARAKTVVTVPDSGYVSSRVGSASFTRDIYHDPDLDGLSNTANLAPLVRLIWRKTVVRISNLQILMGNEMTLRQWHRIKMTFTRKSKFLDQSKRWLRRIRFVLSSLNEDIGAVCHNLLAMIDRDKFIIYFRRLLKHYCKEHAKLAQSKLECATISLLRSRFLRERIAISVANRLAPLSEQLGEEIAIEMVQILDKRPFIESWLESDKAFATDPGPATQNFMTDQIYESGDSDSDSETGLPELVEGPGQQKFQYIEQMKDFLYDGIAFNRLLVELQMILIPEDLRSVARTLLCNTAEEHRL